MINGNHFADSVLERVCDNLDVARNVIWPAYLTGAAAERLGPVKHTAPGVLALSCDLDTSEAVHTLILVVWSPLWSEHLDLEQRDTVLACFCVLVDF